VIPVKARHTAAVVGLFAAAAAYFVLVELHRPDVVLTFDMYGQYLPNVLHAVNSVGDGGRGLLWNPYQACGEPFLANSETALFYPLHLLFLIIEPNAALHVILALNMVIGALGMFLLARELGLGWAAAVGGALVFELGDPMAQLTGWNVTHNGPWAWLPWAFLLVERLLRAPSLARVIALGIVLMLELLPGWVVITALTYQVIALRLLWELITQWELITKRHGRRWRPLAAVVAGLALAPLLAAVQLLPTAELVRDSFRAAFEVEEFARFGGTALPDLVRAIARRQPPVPFIAALLPLLAIAPLISARRRIGLFYLAAGLLYAVLALGPSTPLYAWYALIPPGTTTIRYSQRLFWISGFCMAVLTAMAIDALGAARYRRRWLAFLVVAAVSGALFGTVPGGLRWPETLALAAVVVAMLLVAVRPAAGRLAAWAVVALVGVNLAAVPIRYPGRLLPSLAPYWQHADTFRALRERMTAQDRVSLQPHASSLLKVEFMHKTASFERVPEIYDYNPLLDTRLVEFYTMLWHGAVIARLADLQTAPARMQQRLLDLAAVRYVVASPSMDLAARGLDLPRVALDGSTLSIYDNPGALARARYVPRIAIEPDPTALIRRLAYGDDALAETALVEHPLPSGFTGTDTPAAAGTARIVTDDPEHIVIDVDAPARGFLVLADQYSPGWYASVNGVAAPIVRANHTFRLVEVPAGRARVEFRYRPWSVVIGAAVSAATLAVVAVLLWRNRRRARQAGRAGAPAIAPP
jgi:hypothetical protein